MYYTVNSSYCLTGLEWLQFICSSHAAVCYSGVVEMPPLQLSILLIHCHPPSVVRVTLYKMINSWWKHWRWSINNYHLLDVTLPLHVLNFFTATHLPPQATTRSRLPMALLCRSTATWRGPTVEEREAGWGWPTSTWLTHPVSVLLASELRQPMTKGSASEILPVLDVVPCCLNHLDSPTHKCVDMFVDTRTSHQMHLMTIYVAPMNHWVVTMLMVSP